MNPYLFSQLLSAVKAGKVEGFDSYSTFNCVETPGHKRIYSDSNDYALDVFCADIRRWLTEQGVDWTLSNACFSLTRVENNFNPPLRYWASEVLCKTEVDRHLAAALWWLEQKEKV